MIDLTRSVKAIFSSGQSIDATNTVWRLHSRLTVAMLAFFTVLLSARSYFGDPIECITTSSQVAKSSMHSFCWTLGTFISRDPKFVEASWDFIEIGSRMGNIPKSERLYQKYYQWVPFLLAIQAILFSLPKHLWRFYERGRLATLCDNLTSILPPSAWTPKRRCHTLLYLTQECRGRFTKHAFVFFGCELLNFLIVLMNMFLVNFIFGGFWNSYQPAMQALFSLDMNAWTSYNSLVFPKLAKCDFHYYGPSGTKQTLDALCLLPHNIVNEKIFAFLWLWFILLAIVSGIYLCYRLAQFCCESIRFQLLYTLLYPVSYHRLKRVVREANIGYWFLLYQMARNVNTGVMREVVKDLSKIGQERNLSKHTIQNLTLSNHSLQEPPFEPNVPEPEEEPEDDEVTV